VGWGAEVTLPVTPDWLSQETVVPALTVKATGTKPEGVRKTDTCSPLFWASIKVGLTSVVLVAGAVL